jgi:hypothetical protein
MSISIKATHVARARQRQPLAIACINKSQIDLGVPIEKLTTTLQKCYDNEFLPVWGYPVTLYNARAARPSDWSLLYVDDASSAATLGYHKLTRNSQPVAIVFVKSVFANN